MSWRRGELQTQTESLVDLGGDVRGVALSPSEEHHRPIVEAVLSGHYHDLPDVPWLAVVSTGQQLIASASPMIPSGLFWSMLPDGTVIVASDPLSAARVGGVPEVDPEYLRSYLEDLPPVDRSPFLGVARTPPGVTLTWHSGHHSPRCHSWIGAETSSEPDLGLPDAAETFLDVFDQVVAGLVPLVGRPVASLSGGLDSTFVAASLARQLPNHASGTALHSAPLPGVPLDADGARDPDESRLALCFAQAYPALHLQIVCNVDHVRPLDAAAEASARSGVPSWSPSNQIWINEFHRRARLAGGLGWFEGSHGNVAFSHSHGYLRGAMPPAHADPSRQTGTETAGGRTALGSGLPGSTARRLARTVARLVRSRPAVRPTATLVPGIPDPRSRAEGGEASRTSWLDWLTLRDRGPVQARNPASGGASWRIDPFLAPSVLALAARIRPEAWRAGFPDRAFARSVSAGRVPDEIRLRTTRGAQSWDTWFVMRNDRDDYLDRIAEVPRIAGLESIDARVLARHVASWPWGELSGPPRVEQAVVERVLGLAAFGGRQWRT